MGTVVLRVFREPPLGTQRFLQLAQRSAGGYRLSRVDGISDVSFAACICRMNQSNLTSEQKYSRICHT